MRTLKQNSLNGNYECIANISFEGRTLASANLFFFKRGTSSSALLENAP